MLKRVVYSKNRIQSSSRGRGWRRAVGPTGRAPTVPHVPPPGPHLPPPPRTTLAVSFTHPVPEGDLLTVAPVCGCRAASIPGRSHSIPGHSHSIPGHSHSIPGRFRSIPGRDASERLSWLIGNMKRSSSILLDITGYFWILRYITGYNSILLDIPGYYWILPYITGYYWILLDITGYYWIFLDITVYYWIL